MQQITIVDFLLLPLYLYIIYKIAFSIRDKHYKEGHPWRKYFIKGLTVKLFGAILISLIYVYFYGGGDTLAYFDHIQMANKSITEGPSTWYHVFTNTENQRIPFEREVELLKYYKSPDTATVWQISFFINLFGLFHYLPLCVLLAAISYTGVWRIFRFFAEQYPYALKWIAVACLFVPTAFVWGSGLFKDTYCQMAIGWVLWAFYSMIVKRKWKLKYFFLLLAGGFMLFQIKFYIFITFVPMAFLSQVLKRIGKMRIAYRLALFVLVAAGAYKAVPALQEVAMKQSAKYTIENIGLVAKNSQEYFIRISEYDNGSTFDLGEIDPSVKGMLAKFFPAVNASLFRPYLWESRKPLVLMAGLEAFIFLLATIYTVFLLLKYRRFKIIFDPVILLMLVFAIVFAFLIAITTSNFGSLSRYRIPLIPFYISCLAIIVHYQKTKREKDKLPEAEITHSQMR